MNRVKVLLILLVMLVNLAIAPASWADAGKFKKSPDYAAVTEAIEALVNPSADTQLTAEEIQQQLANLQFQKYILETAEGRAQCTNLTGKTLAVYARPKKAAASDPATLYYLENGQTTSGSLDCEGIYLPAGTPFAGVGAVGTELSEAIALKIVDGTRLTVSANPETGVVSLNVPPLQSFKAGDTDWEIPALAQTDIDTQTPNAPIED